VTHPYPGAFVGDGPARLHLWAGSVLSDRTPSATPGVIADIRPGEGVAVGTGQGVVLLRRVQSAGGAEESADAWALRRGLRPGALMTGVA